MSSWVKGASSHIQMFVEFLTGHVYLSRSCHLMKWRAHCISEQAEEQDSLKRRVSSLFLFLKEGKMSRMSLNTHEQCYRATVRSSAAAPWPTIDVSLPTASGSQYFSGLLIDYQSVPGRHKALTSHLCLDRNVDFSFQMSSVWGLQLHEETIGHVTFSNIALVLIVCCTF